MKILHVIPGLTHERGGPSTVLQALVRHQAEQGHQVAVVATDQGARSGETPVELAPDVALDRSLVRGPDRLAYAPGLQKVLRLRSRACDVMHVHSIFTYPVHVALREALAAGVPLVLRPCGLLHPYGLRRSAWRKRSYLAAWGAMVRRACSAWHFTSPNEARESWPWDSSPRFVLPNGIDPAEYAVDRTETQAWIQGHWPRVGASPYVLFLGRLHSKKRLDLLIEAFLSGAPRPVKLVVAGPDESLLWPGLAARFLHQPSAAERIHYVGAVSGSAKVALLTSAELLALPSEHENFGVTVLEALAAGTPVLLSPHVDLADALAAEDLGNTAPLTVPAWAEELRRLLADRRSLRASSDRARLWVEENYAWTRISRELEERYRWVIAGCPGQEAMTHSPLTPRSIATP